MGPSRSPRFFFGSALGCGGTWMLALVMCTDQCVRGRPSASRASRAGRFAAVRSVFVSGAEHRQERLLRDLDAADLPHALLALFLLLEQLALARDVAAVALRGDVL